MIQRKKTLLAVLAIVVAAGFVATLAIETLAFDFNGQTAFAQNNAPNHVPKPPHCNNPNTHNPKCI